MDLQPTVRIFCELNEDYSLSIRNGKIVLAFANPIDPFQHWIKKAVDGGFVLFNKCTAQAVKRSPKAGPVNEQVIDLMLTSMAFDSPSDPDVVWTESNAGDSAISNASGKGFRLQPHSRLIYDGNIVLLSSTDPGPYQKWKIVPYQLDGVVLPKTFKIHSGEKPNYNLTILNDTVVFAPSDRADPYQHWKKEATYCQHLKDEEGAQAFSLVNVATGRAIKHNIDQVYGYPISLVPFNPTYLDESLLWTEGKDEGSGYKKIRLRKYIKYGLDALYDKEWMSVGLQEGMRVGVWRDNQHASHQWKMEEFS